MNNKRKRAIHQLYGGKTRIRVSGLLIRNERLLLLKHLDLGELGYLWLPPGGGLLFGECFEDAVKREFLEETGLAIEVGQQQFIYEFVKNDFHAVELFYEVFLVGDQKLVLGTDPELPQSLQLIKAHQWMDESDLQELPQGACHAVIDHYKGLSELTTLQGIIAF